MYVKGNYMEDNKCQSTAVKEAAAAEKNVLKTKCLKYVWMLFIL